eukprot:maker-scaffold_32-snap-gene-2.58-mRNA-1 protein AED:0.02 eAED:0.03 QI:0/0/0/1/1/1/2/0/697
MFSLVIIAGSSLLESKYFSSLTKKVTQIENLTLQYHYGIIGTTEAYVIQRHKPINTEEYHPPHNIPYKYMFELIKTFNPDLILSLCSVGTLQPENDFLSPGSFTLCSDFFAPNSYVNLSEEAHIVPNISKKIQNVMTGFFSKHMNTHVAVDSTYCQTRGPRFETKAEIKYYREFGEVIGMTGANEAFLSVEIKTPFCLLGIVDNIANGLEENELTLEKFKKLQKDNVFKIERFFENFLSVDLTELFSGVIKSSPKIKKKYDLIIMAKYIITVDENNTILKNGGIGIRKGIITKIFDTISEKEKTEAIEVKQYPEGILLPGLINAHTHASMVYFRGFGDDLPLKEWLETRIWPAEQKCIHEEFVRDSVELACAEMLLSGITCFNDMYFFPEITAAVCEKIGMRSVIGAIAIHFPSNYAKNFEEYFEKGENLLKKYCKSKLITCCVSPHSNYSLTEEELKKVISLQKKYETKLHIHLHETKAEVEDFYRLNSQTPFQQLEKLDALNENLIGVHMTYLTEKEFEVLVNSGASVVHCPTSNMKLASGVCRVEKMLNKGINVALGTDGAASNNSLNMFAEMKLCSLLQKTTEKNPLAMNSHAALKMATVNGAKALGLETKVGKLEVGLEADCIVVDSGDINMIPMYEPVSHLIYVCDKHNVTDVFVRGIQLVSNRKLLTVDIASIKRKCQYHMKEAKETLHD